MSIKDSEILSSITVSNILQILKTWYLLIIYILVLIILSFSISSISYKPQNAFIAINIIGLLIISIYILLKNSFNEINILFSISLGFYVIVILCALLGYFRRDLEIFWGFSGLFYLPAPMGMFLSSKKLLEEEDWFTAESLFIFVSTFFFGAISVYFYDQTSKLNVLFADLFTIIFVSVILFNFVKFREKIESDENNLKLLILGIGLIIFGLSINIISILVIDYSSNIRIGFLLVGLLVLVFSFLRIDQESYSIVSSDAEFTKTLYLYAEKLEKTIKAINPQFERLSNELITKEETVPHGINNSEVNVLEETTQIPLSEEERKEFKLHLKDEMNGLSISLLIEVGNMYPNSITNAQLQKILKKSKTTIIDQTNRLIKLGYLSKFVDLSDTRKKPFILSEKGYKFLYNLNQIISRYFERFPYGTEINSNSYTFNQMVDQEG